MADTAHASSCASRALLLATLFLMLCLCHGQNLGKLAKLTVLESYKQTLTNAVGERADNGSRVELPVSWLRPLPQQQRDDSSPRFGQEHVQQISDLCESGWQYLRENYHTNTIPGVKITLTMETFALDALGKPGSGILDGNFYAYGSYDECLELDRTMYCIVPVTVESVIPISLGVCVPIGCNTTDITQFVTQQKYTVQKDGEINCNDGNYPYDAGAITMIVVCSMFAALVLLSTFVDWIVTNLPTLINSVKLLVIHEPETAVINSTEITPFLKRTQATPHQYKFDYSNNIYMEFITAFSLFKVVPMVLSTKQPPSAITCINGIRVISMFWVILGHTHLWALFIGTDNIAYVYDKVMPRFTFQGIENATFSVDSFFFLSGLLMAYLTLRQMSRKNGRFPLISYYLHRYLRLTPTYAFILFFFWYMTVHLANGPKYFTTVGPDGQLGKYCEKYWWTNLLYINNFHPWKGGEECLGWTWYLANDMQFFVISPLMVVLLYYSLPIGLIAVSVFLCGSFASTAAIVGYYGYDAAFGANETDIPVAQGDEVYIKPYARISPYLVGIVLGYLLYRKARIPFHTLINWVFYLIMLALAGIFLAAPLYGLYDTQHGHHLSDVENIFYFTFSRFSWGLGLACLVFACHNGYGWVINSFLSMKVWIPLGRLTFTAYLIHPMILFVVFGSLRSPIHYTDITMAVLAVGCVVLTYGTAAVIAVFVEFPLSNLESALFKAVGLGARESTRQVSEPTKNTEH